MKAKTGSVLILLGLLLLYPRFAWAANEPDGQNNDGQHDSGSVDHNGNEPDGNNNNGQFR